MKIGVFGKTFKSASNKLDEIVGEFKYKEVDRVIKNIFHYEVYLKNGDHYRAVTASERSRGYKFDKVLIQEGIDDLIVYNVIFQTLNSHKNRDFETWS